MFSRQICLGHGNTRQSHTLGARTHPGWNSHSSARTQVLLVLLNVQEFLPLAPCQCAFGKEILTDIGTIVGPRHELASEHEKSLLNFKTPAPGSDVFFAASPDIPFPFFERNSYCFEEKKKCESILKSSPEEPISDCNDVSTPPGLWHITTTTHTIPRFCKLHSAQEQKVCSNVWKKRSAAFQRLEPNQMYFGKIP